MRANVGSTGRVLGLMGGRGVWRWWCLYMGGSMIAERNTSTYDNYIAMHKSISHSYASADCVVLE